MPIRIPLRIPTPQLLHPFPAPENCGTRNYISTSTMVHPVCTLTDIHFFLPQAHLFRGFRLVTRPSTRPSTSARLRFQAGFLNSNSTLLVYSLSSNLHPWESASAWMILRDLVLVNQCISEACARASAGARMHGWYISPVRPTHPAATSSFTCRFIQRFTKCWPLLGCVFEVVLGTLKCKLLTR